MRKFTVQGLLISAVVWIACSCATISPAPRLSPAQTAERQQLALKRRDAAVAFRDWCVQQQEAGVALTPSFIELRSDSEWKLATALLDAAKSKDERIAILRQTVKHFEGIASISSKASGQDITWVQQTQSNFELARAQGMLASTESEPVKVPLEHRTTSTLAPSVSQAAKHRLLRARELTDLSEQYIANLPKDVIIDEWYATMYVGAVHQLLIAELESVRDWDAKLSAAQAVRAQFQWMSQRVHARDSAGSKGAQLLVELAAQDIDWRIDSIHNRTLENELLVTAAAATQLRQIAEELNLRLDARDEGGQAMTPWWIMLRFLWERRLLECRLATAPTLEARINAVKAYRDDALEDSKRIWSHGPTPLLRAWYAYQLADAEYERAVIESSR